MSYQVPKKAGAGAWRKTDSDAHFLWSYPYVRYAVDSFNNRLILFRYIPGVETDGSDRRNTIELYELTTGAFIWEEEFERDFYPYVDEDEGETGHPYSTDGLVFSSTGGGSVTLGVYADYSHEHAIIFVRDSPVLNGQKILFFKVDYSGNWSIWDTFFFGADILAPCAYLFSKNGKMVFYEGDGGNYFCLDMELEAEVPGFVGSGFPEGYKKSSGLTSPTGVFSKYTGAMMRHSDLYITESGYKDFYTPSDPLVGTSYTIPGNTLGLMPMDGYFIGSVTRVGGIDLYKFSPGGTNELLKSNAWFVDDRGATYELLYPNMEERTFPYSNILGGGDERDFPHAACGDEGYVFYITYTGLITSPDTVQFFVTDFDEVDTDLTEVLEGVWPPGVNYGQDVYGDLPFKMSHFLKTYFISNGVIYYQDYYNQVHCINVDGTGHKRLVS